MHIKEFLERTKRLNRGQENGFWILNTFRGVQKLDETLVHNELLKCFIRCKTSVSSSKYFVEGRDKGEDWKGFKSWSDLFCSLVQETIYHVEKKKLFFVFKPWCIAFLLHCIFCYFYQPFSSFRSSSSPHQGVGNKENCPMYVVYVQESSWHCSYMCTSTT
jgi:hypothetical protein